MKKTINNFLIFFLLLTAFSSCYEHTEGCRDLNALNFDVVADKDCDDDCCKYPEVYINFSLIKDSIEVDTNSILVNRFNDTFRITELKMYFTGFKLLNTTGDTVILKNSIKIGINASSETIYEDTNYTAVKINLNQSSFKIGTLNFRDNYKQMDFSFGISPLINKVKLDKINTSSPLSILENDMYIDSIQGFYFLKINFKFPDLTSKAIYISGDNNYIPLTLKSELNLSDRENHYLKLDLDISKWILPLDLRKNNIEIESFLKTRLNESLILYKK